MPAMVGYLNHWATAAHLKRGKGFQKSAANPLLKTLLEGRKIRAVQFRSLSSRAEKSVLSSWRVNQAANYNPFEKHEFLSNALIID
ncbi:hypothetical protein TNCV_925361 [Trichonephila clavipes]|nr:hypothetical protein TNCV_925361 [Trichonephila clavipes]